MNNRFYKLFLLATLFLIIFGCGIQEYGLKDNLELILKDDLASIISEIKEKSPSSLLEKPYYRIKSYESFKSAQFSHKAVIEFFYLKEIKMIQVRKFRYSKMGYWERYYKKIEYNL